MAAIFITAGLCRQELVVKLGIETAAQFRFVFPYALGIGLWLALAYLFNRLLGVVPCSIAATGIGLTRNPLGIQ